MESSLIDNDIISEFHLLKFISNTENYCHTLLQLV
jgi:hypothetical protein